MNFRVAHFPVSIEVRTVFRSYTHPAGLGISAVLAFAGFRAAPASAWQLGSNTTFNASVRAKEGYDDNVYLQDVKPDPAVPNAVPARQGSLFTILTPKLRLAYHPASRFRADISYGPDIAFYHSTRSEDYTAHRATLTLAGDSEDFRWEQWDTLNYIDGNRVNPTFGQTFGVPVMGGLAIRDRHAALIYRGGFNLTYPIGRWFLRPVAGAYIHDFLTDQQSSPTDMNGNRIGTYENYVDRWEVWGGLDLGHEIFAKTKLFAGYRYGHQEQGRFLAKRGLFSNDYQRFLLGVEGDPASWLKLALRAGPDLRRWPATTPAGFDRNEVFGYVDASVTLLPTKSDTVALRMTRFLQTAFTSESVYEDIKYDLSWRHKLTEKCTVGAGLCLQIGDWRPPVNRRDWIYTPTVMLNYNFNPHLGLEASWSYNWAQSHVPDLDGIEYHQNVVWLGLKYSF